MGRAPAYRDPVATTRPAPVQKKVLAAGAHRTRSTIALKLAMAVSGIIFVLFVVAHMYGNLKAFGGHDSFNEYAEHLRTIGEPIFPRSGVLWVLRAGLIVSLVVHVWAGLVLWRRAKTARSTKYVVKKNKNSTFSSHWMRWAGVTIGLFLIWHLLNFSIGKINVKGGPTNDPYNLLVDSFDTWWLTVIYLVAMAALGMHIRHGVWSSIQTLGYTNTARSRRNANILGVLLAVVIAGGFSLVPIFTLVGVID